MKTTEGPNDIKILKLLNQNLYDTFLEDFENEVCEGEIDTTEIPIFCGALTMALYALLTPNHVDYSINKFGSWVTGKITNEYCTSGNSSISENEIDQFFNNIATKLIQRQDEFIDLIKKEMFKSAAERTFEKITKLITGYLFGKPYFDVILEGIIREHIRSVFLTLKEDRQ